jgi:hypothetical protein
MKMLKRAPSLNDDPVSFPQPTYYEEIICLLDSEQLFISAMADIVAKHLESQTVASPGFFQKCHGCNVASPELCRTVINPCHGQER